MVYKKEMKVKCVQPFSNVKIDDVFEIEYVEMEKVGLLKMEGSSNIEIATFIEIPVDLVHKYFQIIPEKIAKSEETTERSNLVVSEEMIDDIIENAEFEYEIYFDKTLVLNCKLANGFVITESSSCIDPQNFDEEVGFDLCFERIKNKIYEFEAYRICAANYEEAVKCNQCEEKDNCEARSYLL